MKETVYLETSVISYYTARPSRDIIVLAHQEITWDWWSSALNRYDAFISEAVIDEASMGNPEASSKRLAILKDFPRMELNELVEKRAKVYITKLNIPERAFRDAAHIAVSSVHNIDYLVTWNCTYIANASISKKLMSINSKYNMQTPTICTPEELMGE